MFTRRTLFGTAAAVAFARPAVARTEIKIGHGHSDRHSFHLAMAKLGEILEQKAPGAFRVSLFPQSQLGSEREMQEQVALGTLEVTVTGVLGIYEPKMALLELPFLFRDRAHILRAQKSEAVLGLAESLPPKGLRLIGFLENGFRNITNNVRPINAPADVRGLKIRTPENPAQVETFRALGANPTPMPFSELYTALRQGVVDGQENPLQNIFDGKLHEVQRHLAITAHIYNSAYVVISEAFLRRQSEAHRRAILAAAEEAGRWQFELIAQKDGELLETLKRAGMQVTTPDQAAFRTATAPAYEAFYGRFGDPARRFVQQVQAM
ncbi:TRAP transporter substrate-binding protein [Elioraea sp.]|uniref:TRAP transporter substrate-binding protein n=1 Tax=Elioraea sp. TaxID=2185103 RepID=UPI003F7242B2